MSEDRITRLEERLAYVERFLEDLSAEFGTHAARIDEIFKRLEALADVDGDLGPHDQKPPHY